VPLVEFVRDCIERAGGAAECRGPALIEALLPAALVPEGVEREALLALDSQALAEETQAEPATVGSPLLDSLIAHAAGRGATSVACLVPARLKRKGLREEVERTLRFSGCRVRYDAADPDVLCAGSVQFNFKVTFLSDERRERLYVIPVNLWSNQVNPELAEHLASAVPVTELPAGLPEAPGVPLRDAYQAAQRALRVRVREVVAQYQDRAKKRFSVESLRVREYYEQVGRELKSRFRDGDPQRARVLEAKLQAAQADCDRKLLGLGEKHRLRLRARLTSARLLLQPKTFYRLLIDRGPTTRGLTLAYDSLLERLEPPSCDACGTETTRVHALPGARLLCPACAAR
jgi:hypothetical protein